MEKTDTDAIQEINTNTRSMKLCANVYHDESKLGLYLLTKSLVPREVQRMIVYKMTPPPLDVRPSPSSRLMRASRRASSGNSVRMLGKSRIAYDVPRRRPGPSAMCFSTFSCR